MLFASCLPCVCCPHRSHCSQPLQALELVACMAAVMASSAQAGVLSLGVKVLSSYSTEAALQTMPHNLPALLSHKLWQPSIEVISEQLLAILRSTEGPMDNTFHSLADPMVNYDVAAITCHKLTSIVSPEILTPLLKCDFIFLLQKLTTSIDH